jgi:hypothetical protein
MTTPMTAQDVQEAFADAILRFMGERSTILETTLFDLPSKIILGQYCGVAALPGVFAELERRIPGDELGRRRRVPGLPLALGLSGILWIYLFGRLQRYLDAGWPEHDVDLGDHEEAARIIGYWEQVARAYRGDGTIVPQPGDPAIRALDDDAVDGLAARARERGRPQDTTRVRRAAAQLSLYLFLIHGEQRDGIFHHGPYALDDGSVLVVREFTDLANRFMPWMTEERRLPVSRVVMPMILDHVDCQFDMYGTLYTDPEDYFDRITGFEILADDQLEPIAEEQLEELSAESQLIQREVFRGMARWDERYKLLHAASQYANVNHPFLELAGCTDDEIFALLIRPFEAEAEGAYDLVARHGGKVWERVASGQRPLFPELR